MNKTLLLLSSLTVHCSYRLKFFVVKDHLWDGNSHKCSLLGSIPLKGLSAQRVGVAWRSRRSETESSVHCARRSRAIHYKINDDVCGFHPVLYATLYVLHVRIVLCTYLTPTTC